jgi:hypothetical protein
MLLWSILLAVVGAAAPSRAENLNGHIYCYPGIDASGVQTTTCENADGDEQGPKGGDNGSTDPADRPLGIKVLVATYGGNCGAHVGNDTHNISLACGGESTCDYVVDYRRIGDPVPGCAKQYSVSYRCGLKGVPRSVTLGAEAGFGSVAALSCE